MEHIADSQDKLRWAHIGLLGFFERNQRGIFIAILFVMIFVIVRAFIRPVNVFDYGVYVRAMNYAALGQNPYLEIPFVVPPWSVLFLRPLAMQPAETWLALNAALFVAMTFDIGKPSGLLLMATPIFITLMVTANPEWLLTGAGLWLIYRAPRGWGRGIAWLLLSCKTTAIFFLLIDGWQALRERDWKAFSLAGFVAAGSLLAYPQFFAAITDTPRLPINSLTIVAKFGVAGALVFTVLVVGMRRKRLGNGKTLALLLGPVWVPNMYQYHFIAAVFTMRHAGWLANGIYLVLSIGLAALFWRAFLVNEHLGLAAMLLLMALMAPLPPDEQRATPVAASG